MTIKPGKTRFVFYPMFDDLYGLKELRVYSDGRVLIPHKFVMLSELKAEFEARRLFLSVPSGSRVDLYCHAVFEVGQFSFVVTLNDFLKELEDERRELNKEKTSNQICREALEQFKENPTEANKETLRNAYLEVPSHLRSRIGDMDVKDSEVKRLLGLL